MPPRPIILPRRPWNFGPAQDVDVTAEQFLARRWQSPEVRVYTEPDPTEGETTAPVPYATWPGLAPGCPPGQDPDQFAAWYVASDEVRAGAVSDPFSLTERHPDTRVPNPFVGRSGQALLGLVETPDSAGAIASSGWIHQLGGGPGCTAVLRSWQERYGVRLCVLGADWLAVTVARAVPVDEIELARRVAAEHVAFCPDILGMVDFEDYAQGLITAAVWRFWWD